MEDIKWLKDNYLIFLKEKSNESKVKIENLKKEERLDEANLEKIRLNVIEIFSKMFTISNSDDPKILKDKYLSFFDKITKPWYINKEKALKFDKQKEAIIEEIKIEEAESLKSKFKDYYSKMDK
ncbi:hypothetical protein [Anaerosalibacter sp. Marseille-P3206]|uniref:hypothetical protein n=1 Tax=Anaerosalibacter sp. Marseille-P3206 TaxID=1871005 RepID=UPI0009864B9E|nr:hypothetical protein [Anaerosalibacter sp. Marseille-P3206]